MNIHSLKKELDQYQLFSINDIRKLVPNFHKVQVSRWIQQGYIKRAKNGLYYFSDQFINEPFLYAMANKIYEPSYISLESALKYYGLIPEEVFQITSVSTKKKTGFETEIGHFNYRHIKPELFWGYKIIRNQKQKYLIAEPEKAVLDYFYVNHHLETKEDFEGIRINENSWYNQVDNKKFTKYAEAFHNKALLKRIKLLLSFINNDSY